MDITTQVATTAATGLFQYGVLGIFTIILVYLAYVFIKREQRKSDECTAENQSKDLEIQRLNNVMIEKMVPALISATQSILASQTIMQKIQYQKDVEMATLKKGAPDAD